MEEVILRPWAKINLYLEVLGRYDDGYHQIRTLIQPVALFDELQLRRTLKGLQVKCVAGDIPGKELLPPSAGNLVSKAAELFFSKINKNPSVSISLVKNIPVGGGLGGGSSDAASTLIGLNKLYRRPLSNEELAELTCQLGMDVPCFLEPTPVLCSGRGEVIEKRLDGDKRVRFWCILVNPGKGLSTASVYKSYSLSLTHKRSSYNILPLYDDIDIYNIDNIIKYIRNDLEATAINLFPELNDITILLRREGVLKSFVCGSGSTICGLVRYQKDAEEIIGKMALYEKSRNWWMKAVPTL